MLRIPQTKRLIKRRSQILRIRQVVPPNYITIKYHLVRIELAKKRTSTNNKMLQQNALSKQ